MLHRRGPRLGLAAGRRVARLAAAVTLVARPRRLPDSAGAGAAGLAAAAGGGVAESVLAAAAVSVAAAGLASSRSALGARLRLPSLSDLKSVSYQPEPLSLNTGAEINRLSRERPQEGHFLSGPSLIFCITSR